jgi:hypothetical protein
MAIDFIRALLGSIVAIEGQLLQEFFLEIGNYLKFAE